MYTQYFLFPEDFLEALKKAAKAEKKLSGIKPHSAYLNEIAQLSGCSNWSVFSKRISNLDVGSQEYSRFREVTNKKLSSVLLLSINSYVDNDILRFANSSFEKFSNDYATPVNGSSSPTVDIAAEIESAYGNIYAPELLGSAIERVRKCGPWGVGDIMIDEFSNFDGCD